MSRNVASAAGGSSRSVRPVRSSARIVLLLALGATLPVTGRAEELAPSLYVRSDSDHTTVISPRLRARAPLGEATNLDFVYSVDIWTSASIDVVASASEAVTEQRDEIDVGIDHAFPDLTLSAGYRYSHEPDYLSNGGHVGASLDLADKSTTLAAGLSFSIDDVGRAGDPGFSRASNTFGAQASITQVIDPNTLVQALYDITRIGGYQSSPYRRIGVGGDGLCRGRASWCVEERNPDERIRQAWAVRIRRALGEHHSAGGGYRFYADSWGIRSHTFQAGLTWVPDHSNTLALEYRGYVQSSADHYRARYTSEAALQGYITSDKELSALSSQRVMLNAEHAFVLDAHTVLRAALAIGPTFYAYSDFIYLSSMTALDVTTSAVLEF